MSDVSDGAAAPKPLTRRQVRAAQVSPTPAPLPKIPEAPFLPLLTGVVLAACLLLALSAYAGPVLVAVAVTLGGLVLAWGWAGLLGLPSPRGTTAVLAIGTLAMVASSVFTHTEPYLRWMPAAVAFSLIVAFVHQLARRDGRPRLVESVACTVMGLTVISSGATLVPLPDTYGGNHVVAAAALAVAASALTDFGDRWEQLRHWLLPLAMLAGAGAAMLVALFASQVTWGPAALLGVVACGVSHAVRRVLSHLPTIHGARPQLVCAIASVLTSGVVVYTVSRLFVS
jgi:hypothetical protein